MPGVTPGIRAGQEQYTGFHCGNILHQTVRQEQIIARLEVFEASTLEAWYDYFRTGRPESFFALMESLPSAQGDRTQP